MGRQMPWYISTDSSGENPKHEALHILEHFRMLITLLDNCMYTYRDMCTDIFGSCYCN